MSLAIPFDCTSSLPAVLQNHDVLSYSQLAQNIKQLALYFLHQNIRPGSRVAFLADPSLSSILSFLALLEIGASPCLLSTRVPPEKIPVLLRQARVAFFLNSSSVTSFSPQGSTPERDPSIFLFTSGSSKAPKLVSLKPQHFLANAQGAQQALGLSLPGTCFWQLSVPLFHVSGLILLFRCFSSHNALILSPFSSGHPLTTHLSLVPTQLLRLLEQNTPFPKISHLLIGGSSVPETFIQRASQKHLPLFLTYGMTEMASQITMTTSQASLLPVHYGKPLPGREVRLSPNGEILVRGDCLFTGYDTSEEGVYEKGLLEDGWFATGDLGAWSTEGYLQYKGRKDNLFISGGENIYPEEIEQALLSLPGVLQAVVLPLDDREFGQRPVAFVLMENLWSKEEFHEKLTPLLPRFCFPIHFFPFPPFLKEPFLSSQGEALPKIKRPDFISWLQKLNPLSSHLPQKGNT